MWANSACHFRRECIRFSPKLNGWKNQKTRIQVSLKLCTCVSRPDLYVSGWAFIASDLPLWSSQFQKLRLLFPTQPQLRLCRQLLRRHLLSTALPNRTKRPGWTMKSPQLSLLCPGRRTYVTLHKLDNLSGLKFPHLWNTDNNNKSCVIIRQLSGNVG